MVHLHNCLNPNIQAAERSTQPHFGGRTVLKYSTDVSASTLTFDAGAEWQQGFINASIHKNVGGRADSIRTYDEIANRQSLVFGQATLDLQKWTLSAGASLNISRVTFQRFIPRPLPEQNRKFDNKTATRFAISRKLGEGILYASVAKGFSPPTTEELLPTGGDINLDLNAEEGTNYDLGFRYRFFDRLSVDVNAFHFSLSNSIVTRRTAGGGGFFINAGKTAQQGIETSITYPLLRSSTAFERSTFWLSHTYHHFRYRDFIKDTISFSGNDLPGVAPHTISTGADFLTRNGLFGNINFFYSGKTALNDANTVFADGYNVLSAKLGYQKDLKNKWRIKLFAGVDNLLDETYSLGNDINGFGGRYFNAAPGSNYYGGLIVAVVEVGLCYPFFEADLWDGVLSHQHNNKNITISTGGASKSVLAVIPGQAGNFPCKMLGKRKERERAAFE